MVSAFLLCATFEMMGFWDGFGAYLYSRRLMPCGRGLMAPPGLTALGAKGSACDRLTPPGRVEGSALGRYIVPLRWRSGRPWGRQYKCRLWRRKSYNRLGGRWRSPFWWLAPPPFSQKRGHYKAPLCCELLMKGLLFRALFCPLHRGKSGADG